MGAKVLNSNTKPVEIRCLWNTQVKLPRGNLKRHFFQFLELQRKAWVREIGTDVHRQKGVCMGGQWETRKDYIVIAPYLSKTVIGWSNGNSGSEGTG